MLKLNQEIEIDQFNQLKLAKTYQPQLEQLINSTLQPEGSDVSEVGGVMSVNESGRCLLVTIVPWTKSFKYGYEGHPQYQVAIFITDCNQYITYYHLTI